jgi:hypothetical protein
VLKSANDVKKAAVMSLFVLFVGVSFAGLSTVMDDPTAPLPEFYFTRLIYSQNGYYGRPFTMRNPGPYRCPEFGGKNFFPPQGWGWATDSPGADCKLMGAIHRLTGMRVYENPNWIEIMDKDLFKFPYSYIVEPGQMRFTDQEAAQLREYLLRGGFLHLDDFWGLEQKANMVRELKKVFPDRSFEPLPLAHQIFHTFFDINEVMLIPGQRRGCAGVPGWEQADDKEPRVLGISDDEGRVMVVATYNSDLGDAWEYMDAQCYPEKFAGQAIRLEVDFRIYAMTH